MAFAAGGVLGLVGLWLRVSVEETAHFTAAARAGQREDNPLWSMLIKHQGAAWRVVAITIPGALTYYIWVSYILFLAADSGRFVTGQCVDVNGGSTMV